MARSARVVIPGWPHHVTQRGNQRQTVFFRDRDREVYLDCLDKYRHTHHLTLIGYALMGNHIHCIPIPEFHSSLAKGIGRTNNDYSRWLNVQRNQVGHLWQSRFYSCPVDLASLAVVLAYVELNPVRAGLVARADDWKWSSARAHASGVDETGLLDMAWWQSHFTPDSWARYLRMTQDDRITFHKIRTATQTGKPFASEAGLREAERILGKSLKLRNRRFS